ncbi:MAG: asparaginase domain-containing protein [Planctomycetota bacterium]
MSVDARNKPSLCLVTTGGTVSMTRGSNAAEAALPVSGATAIDPGLRSRYDIDAVELFRKDSGDFGPGDWSAVVEAVASRWDRYDGFVVSHGTDTLAYTAAALALELGAPPLARTVVLTGAMRRADHEQPDGPGNLADACAAASRGYGEVVVAFAGKVWRGCRVVKRVGPDRDGLDAFHTPGLTPLGGHGHSGGGKPLPARHGFADGVLPIALSPGVGPGLFLDAVRSDACRAVWLRGYGSGNVPLTGFGGDGSWIDFVTEATRRDKPVVLSSPLVGGTTRRDYAGAAAAWDAGAIPAGGVTEAMAVVKLRWALAKAGARGGAVVPAVRAVMQRDWVGEGGGAEQAPPLPD